MVTEMDLDSQWGQEDDVEKLLEESYELKMKSHSSRSAAVVIDDNDDSDRHGQRLLRLVPGHLMEMQRGCNCNMDGGRACVLYKDYNGFLSPIRKAYYSQDSRSVVSSHPTSLCREAEVMYCPQLCGFFCVETEAHACKGRCPRCYGCPVCGTALLISPTNCLEGKPSGMEKRGGDSLLASSSSSWSFSCPYCMWSGASQGLVAQDKEALIKLLVGNEDRDMSTKVFNALVVGVRSQAVASSKAAREDRRMCVRSDGGRGGLRELEPEGDHNSYSNSGINCVASSGTMESLCKDLDNRGAMMISERESLANVGLLAEDAPPLYTQQSEGSADDETGLGLYYTTVKDSSCSDDSAGSSQGMNVLESPTLPSLKMRLEQQATRMRSETKLLSLRPQRLPLRVKCAKRCAKDVNAGRTGLLVKPKANPEEGDSTSDRAGQWFKKDCSALYSVPEITVVPPMEFDSITLCITNPQETPLDVHLTETSPLPEVVSTPSMRLLHCEVNANVKLPAKEDELLSSTIGGAIDVTHNETKHASKEEEDDGIGGKCPGILRIEGNTGWIRIPVIHCQHNVDEQNSVQQHIASKAPSILAVAIDMRIESEADNNPADCSMIIAWDLTFPYSDDSNRV